jgi:hypothetical protein
MDGACAGLRADSIGPPTGDFPTIHLSRVLQMSDVNNRMRMHALAAATAVALTTMVSMPAMAGGRVNLSGLQPNGATYDRFIVKYRDGSAERKDSRNVAAALQRASATPIGGKAVG